MKAKLRYNHWIPKVISKLIMPISAITLYPYILFTDKKMFVENDVFEYVKTQDSIERHESIHIAQYEELYVVGFLWIYCWDYLKGRLKGRNHYEAYVHIRLEQEAYDYSYNPIYLKTRKPFAWRKFKA